MAKCEKCDGLGRLNDLYNNGCPFCNGTGEVAEGLDDEDFCCHCGSYQEDESERIAGNWCQDENLGVRNELPKHCELLQAHKNAVKQSQIALLDRVENKLKDLEVENMYHAEIHKILTEERGGIK